MEGRVAGEKCERSNEVLDSKPWKLARGRWPVALPPRPRRRGSGPEVLALALGARATRPKLTPLPPHLQPHRGSSPPVLRRGHSRASQSRVFDFQMLGGKDPQEVV